VTEGWHHLRTSAKTGACVEEAFGWLAGATLRDGSKRP